MAARLPVRIIIISLFFSFGSALGFAQSVAQSVTQDVASAQSQENETPAGEQGAALKAVESEPLPEEDETEQPLELKKSCWFLTFGPMLLVNTDSKLSSAPSPVMYAGGIGFEAFRDKPLLFETRLSFFTNYYSFDGTDAQPSEVENRTATGLSFMIDATTGHEWRWGKNAFSVQAGLGILARIGVLSSGVASDDEGWSVSSSAGDDVSSINKWFWKDMHYLYPQILVSYMRNIPLGLRAGVEFRAYIPMGLLSGGGLDDSIFSLAAKLEF